MTSAAGAASDSLAERLAVALARAGDGSGAEVVFGLPGGGSNLDVIGAATDAGARFVLAHTETAAAIMASTYGLVHRSPAAVVVTRGPGAASVVNGVAQATLDRYPLVVVTDCVPAATSARVSHQRIDQRALLAPVTKRSATITDATSPAELQALVDLAGTWPLGAVHVDVDPTAAAPTSAPSGPPAGAASPVADPDAIAEARALVARSERPVVIVGMEAAVAAATTWPRLPAELTALGLPVLTTYQAIGTVDTEGPVGAGLFTNGALERPVLDRASLIVTIGLDTVEPIPAPWTSTAPVVRLSAVSATDDYLPATVDLVGDLPTLFEAVLAPKPTAEAAGTRWAWEPDAADTFRRQARERLAASPDASDAPPSFGPLALVEGLIDAAPDDATVTVDAGAHFLAAMPRWPVRRPFGLLISNGLATMGFALPAAIGAALARPGTPVLALTGDGGLSMVQGELETIVRLDLPIAVVVFNDSALSLIEIKQGAHQGGADAVRYGPVDLGATARAVGLDAVVVHSSHELAAALAGPWWGPRLIDARIDPAPYRHLLQVTRG